MSPAPPMAAPTSSARSADAAAARAAAAASCATVSASFRDPGRADHQTGQVNWGDGIVENQSAFSSFSDAFDGALGSLAHTHRYALGGQYTLALSVSDDDGGFFQEAAIGALVAGLRRHHQALPAGGCRFAPLVILLHERPESLDHRVRDHHDREAGVNGTVGDDICSPHTLWFA